MEKKRDIVVLSISDWSSFWFQKQEIAKRFLDDGYKVHFINRSPQRWPKLFHILQRLRPNKKTGFFKNPAPEGMNMITPLWLPPARWLRFISQWFVKRTVRQMNLPDDYVLITFLPTYNALDFIRFTKPATVAYINVHNYDADARTMKDVLRSEKELIKQCDYIFGDSHFNRDRVNRIGERSDALLSPPGVYSERFREAFRGDEAQQGSKSKLVFFGNIGTHLNIPLYNALAEKFDVTFIGVVNPAVDASSISEKITLRDPVPPTELQQVLKDYDILTILYYETPYIDGVIPAKLFECMAMGKPMLVGGLKEARRYLDVVYDLSGDPKEAEKIIMNLSETETKERISQRFEYGVQADWANHFKRLKSYLKV